MASETWQQQKWSKFEAVEKADSREETNEIKISYKRVSSRNQALVAFGAGLYKEICAVESKIKIIETCLRYGNALEVMTTWVLGFSHT